MQQTPMNSLMLDEVRQYVNDNIDDFHRRRKQILSLLTLSTLLKKNPYLFRAKNITKASELVEGTMSAFLSSSEEKLFGDFLEGLAIFVAEKTTGGHKSSSQGVDLEFISDNTHYIVPIKSGIADTRTVEQDLPELKITAPVRSVSLAWAQLGDSS
jgi:hypothetical protein